MLVGPSMTLNELEQKINDRLIELKDERNDMIQETAELQKELEHMSYYKTNDEGERVPNEDFIEKNERFDKNRAEMKKMEETEAFLREKRKELEDIDENPRSLIDKEKQKVNLTLNDCIYLNYKPEQEEVSDGTE